MLRSSVKAFGWRIAFLLSCVLRGSLSLKDVQLTIEPHIVQRGKSATLRCTYDLEDDPLYTVKWFRGQYEFFRFRAQEEPQTIVFPVPGTSISVDESRSNFNQVVIQDIQFNLAGNFSCEVTTTNIKTGMDMDTMMVVELPSESPTIEVKGEPFDAGHTLRATCYSPPSKPPAKLRFTLNNITVPSSPLSDLRSQETSGSDTRLEMKLSEYHFNNGRLILSCQAQVQDIYYKEAVLELKTLKNPKPARVMFPGSQSRRLHQNWTLIVTTLLARLILCT